MYKTNTVVITLTASNKTGVLSFLMRHGAKFDLLYKKSKKEVLAGDKLRLVVFYGGKIKLSEKEITESFEEHSSILKVENIASLSSEDVEQKMILERDFEPSSMFMAN